LRDAGTHLTSTNDEDMLESHRAAGYRRARLVEVDSDHYLTLREPDLVTRLLEEFLVIASTRANSSY
jgi:hypothetical protein